MLSSRTMFMIVSNEAGYATPAIKGARLVEQLNAIALGAQEDDLVLRRIDHEAQKMVAADPAEAHTVLGAVAALEGRANDVRKHFLIALQQSGHSAWVSGNYACALMNLGQTVEALEIARQASQRTPDDLLALRESITAALQTGHIREARTLQNRFSRLSPGRPLPDESVAQMLGDAVDRGVFREESVVAQSGSRRHTPLAIAHRPAPQPS